MNIKNILLFSFTLITGLTFNHAIIAMEETKQSVEKELSTLDTTILHLAQQLELAEEQQNKDEIEFNICMAKRKEEPLTDCSAQIRAYKGKITYRSNNEFDDDSYSDTGSESKYLKIRFDLGENSLAYVLFERDFKRGKDLNDIDYLKSLALQIQQKNTLNEQKNITKLH